VSKPNTLHVEPSGILEIAARRGQLAVLSALLEAKLGLGFPEPGRAVGWVKPSRATQQSTGGVEVVGSRKSLTQPTCTALWIGPERALLLAVPEVLAAVREANTPARAALIDQTSGYTIWQLAGPDVGQVLVRICRIDLHDSVFGTNYVARTIMAQIPTVLHRIDDSQTFRLIVPSTLARSFGENIKHAAKASGIDIHTHSEPAQ
jgi:heterotetrameric sarcosine oxidase gamma subunit